MVTKLEQQYKELLLELLPQGRAWVKTGDSNMSNLVGGLAKEFARIHSTGEGLPKDLTALYTENFLDEWEETLKTQDDCNEIDDTFIGRKNAVLAKLRSVGGSSIKYLEDYAKNLGFPVTITDGFGQFKAGKNKAGDACAGDAWRLVFQVRAPETTTRYFKAGQNKAGEPLASFGSELLECAINRIKPAHTIPLFLYFTIQHQAAVLADAVISAQATLNQRRHGAADVDAIVQAGIYELWKPSYLENLVAWFDAKDFSSADAVAEWTNKADNILATNALQSNASIQPDSVLGALNSRPVVRFAQGDKMQVRFNQDLSASKNLDIFIAGKFTNQGVFFNRGQYDGQLGATLESKALTKSWHVKTVGNQPINYGSGNFVVRFSNKLVMGLGGGLYYSTDEGETWTSVTVSGSGDSVYCRGANGGFALFDGKLYISSGSVKKIYEWDGTGDTCDEYDLSGLISGAGDTDGLCVHDGALYCALGQDPRVAKFNDGAGTWSVIGDTGLGTSGVAYTRNMVSDGTNLYLAVQTSDATKSLWEWDGTTFSNINTGLINIQVIVYAQGTLWVFQTGGKVYNLANGWGTYITIPGTTLINPKPWALVDDGASLIIGDYSLGSPSVRTIRYEFDGTTLSNDQVKSSIGYTGDHFFWDANNNELLAGSYNSRLVSKISKQGRIVESDSVPSTAIFHFNFYNTDMSIRINGETVAELRFDSPYDFDVDSEDYRNERILQELIDVTSGLVTVVDNLVTINPTTDLPNDSVVEIAVDDGAITGWGGVDDWYFVTEE